MIQTYPAQKDLVLLGGGHSNIAVLKRFGMRPEPGIRLTLVSDAGQTPYSGMLPGTVAGIYSEAQMHINLVRLSRFANARFIQAQVGGLNLEKRQVHLLDRPSITFDGLSINTGAQPVKPHPNAITVKPIAKFLPAFNQLLKRVEQGHTSHVLVVGGGAGGVELAMNLRARLPSAISITLAGRHLLPGHGDKMRKLVLEKLSALNISWCETDVASDLNGDVELLNGQQIPCADVLWVTNVKAPAWAQDSGLMCDADGFVLVDKNLQALHHKGVFAAGDVCALQQNPRPKAGVFAVRAGPLLAANLRRYLLHMPLRQFEPQQEYLALIGCGDRTAIASRGKHSFYGKFWGSWVWRWKDHIDQKFMHKFNDVDLSAMLGEAPQAHPGLGDLPGPSEQMRCGGCGAKLAAEPLRRVLQRLPSQPNQQVLLGIGDDAAQIVTPEQSMLLSVDGFRAMIDDPFVFGRIATHHSLNDLFAMGSMPKAALAYVTLPYMADALLEEDLYQVLSGITSVLNPEGASLVGGHSAEGSELSVALSVVGQPGRQTWHKAGAQVGQKIVVTKPIGTGTLLAAAMQGMVDEALTEVVRGMDLSNAEATTLFTKYNVGALTDVTGFGLLGHLGEILRASEVGCHLDVEAIATYNKAIDTIGVTPSTLQMANERVLDDFELRGIAPTDAKLALLCDPQTSGGLMATIEGDQADACLAELRNSGYVNAFIAGEITEAGLNLVSG